MFCVCFSKHITFRAYIHCLFNLLQESGSKEKKTFFLFFKSKNDQAQPSHVTPDTPKSSRNEQETSNVASNNQPTYVHTPDTQQIEVDITSLERDPGLRLPIRACKSTIRSPNS